MKKTAIIGGGPAGMTAAIAALSSGQQTDLYDQNEKLGKKLYITGKGRCNLTNHCDISEFFDSIVTNKNFLYSALYTFTNDALMDMMEERQVQRCHQNLQKNSGARRGTGLPEPAYCRCRDSKEQRGGKGYRYPL